MHRVAYVEKENCMQKKFDPCCRFDATPVCDRYTDRQTDRRRQLILTKQIQVNIIKTMRIVSGLDAVTWTPVTSTISFWIFTPRSPLVKNSTTLYCSSETSTYPSANAFIYATLFDIPSGEFCSVWFRAKRRRRHFTKASKWLEFLAWLLSPAVISQKYLSSWQLRMVLCVCRPLDRRDETYVGRVGKQYNVRKIRVYRQTRQTDRHVLTVTLYTYRYGLDLSNSAGGCIIYDVGK